MGGSPRPKRPSNAERNASMLAAKRSGDDFAELRSAGERQRNARKRSPLLGGPEALMPTTLGVN